MTRTTDETNAINRVLKAWGLGTIDQPDTVRKLAYCVDNHHHFMTLLRACEPDLRREMYNAMAPNLTFTARTLEEYMIEAKAYAESAELPVMDAQGNLHQYYPPEVNTKDRQVIDVAIKAIEAITAKGYLEVVCRKCTRVERFYAPNKAEGIFKAREASWAYDELTRKETCPDCLGIGKGR